MGQLTGGVPDDEIILDDTRDVKRRRCRRRKAEGDRQPESVSPPNVCRNHGLQRDTDKKQTSETQVDRRKPDKPSTRRATNLIPRHKPEHEKLMCATNAIQQVDERADISAGAQQEDRVAALDDRDADKLRRGVRIDENSWA